MTPIEQEIQNARKDLAKRIRSFVSDRWILAHIFLTRDRSLDCPYRVSDEVCTATVDHILAA